NLVIKKLHPQLLNMSNNWGAVHRRECFIIKGIAEKRENTTRHRKLACYRKKIGIEPRVGLGSIFLYE
ncbi:hypothetical protein, partial [Brevibacillus borstelensis]|uniref:hypothetical protein n=1 Tax=Brevibacillus borstelensis TaxID=45462 RepID=UPI000564C7F9